MEDFTALAGMLSASVGDARGALILSKDGLVLGADPADAESLLKPAWLHFASLGEPERGFVQFGTEIWCYVRRGPYAAFVVSGAGVRPGLVIDQIEMVLLSAEQTRSKRELVRTEPAPPAPATAPSSKPRTPLHPEVRPSEQPPVVLQSRAAQAPPSAAPVSGPTMRGPQGPTAGSPPGNASEQTAEGDDLPSPRERPSEPGTHAAPEAGSPPIPPPETPAEGTPTGPRQPQRNPKGTPATSPAGASVWGSNEASEEEEVDRFSLAREFSQLLQEGPEGADG